MERVRAQNAALRGALESLAHARSELAGQRAHTQQLQRHIHALRAGTTARALCAPPSPQAPPPSSGLSCSAHAAPHPGSAQKGAQVSASVGSAHRGPDPADERSQAVEADGEVAGLGGLPAAKEAQLQLLRARLDVAASQSADLRRLTCLYEACCATAAAQEAEIASLREQVGSWHQGLMSAARAIL